MGRKVMNDREAANLMGWGIATLKRRSGGGVFPSVKLGGRRFYYILEMEYWLSCVKNNFAQNSSDTENGNKVLYQIEQLEEGLRRLKILLPELLNKEHNELMKLTNKFQDFIATLITKYDNDTETTLD